METQATSKRPGWLLVVLGIIEIILGTIAIFIPFIVGEAFVWVLGFVFLAAMLFNFYQVFAVREYKLWNFLAALVYGLMGVLFIWHPVAVMVSLTLLIGWILIVGGIIRLVMSFKTKGAWLIFNGVVTLLLGILIVTMWPAAGLWVLGTFVAIDLIFSGWTLATLGTTVNRTTRQD